MKMHQELLIPKYVNFQGQKQRSLSLKQQSNHHRHQFLFIIILLVFLSFISVSWLIARKSQEAQNERKLIELLEQMNFFQESLVRKEQLQYNWKAINTLHENNERRHRFHRGHRLMKVPPISDEEGYRRICYYTVPIIHQNNHTSTKNFHHQRSTNTDLSLVDVNGTICTHINIGNVHLNTMDHGISISEEMDQCLSEDVPQLRKTYPNIKFLLWIGGGDWNSIGFHAMIQNHTTRKQFIRSLKVVLAKYHLDGCDLDWEYPTAYNRERQHFSQLLYEIRAEYKRERKPYLLSVAVAADEGIAYFSYDVRMINKYVDHVNLMSYDYHAYTKLTPFTGLNAPLYARTVEHSILATLNINYSVNWWITNGLDRRKLLLGLPTYGHTFKLVNPFNREIGSPAAGLGDCGELGYATYGEICRFKYMNIGIQESFDRQACVPYLSAGLEWISYENPDSIHCKVQYIKEMNLGGATLFSLNADDHIGVCDWRIKFPLGQMMASKLRKLDMISK